MSSIRVLLMCIGSTIFAASDVKAAYSPTALQTEEAMSLFAEYCLDCHSGDGAEGRFDFAKKLERRSFDATLAFENLITQKMPPADAEAPTNQEQQKMLAWLAGQQKELEIIPFRRLSRHEFVHSVNDLLGSNLDLAAEIPQDRGTRNFDSDRRIGLSHEMLGSYFAVADQMLEHALPRKGFINEQN